MSYLDAPRIHFFGTFFANPSTINNTLSNFDLKPPLDLQWNPDGSANPLTLTKDTSADRVLISRDFFYFGKTAAAVPAKLLEQLGFRNVRSHRVFEHSRCAALLRWLTTEYRSAHNMVAGDPFDFDDSARRYTGKGSTLR